VQIRMPPLRERREDLPMLVAHLLELINAECRAKILGVSPQVMSRFQEYAWPGNVRELANVLRHAVIMADDTVVTLEDCPEYLADPRSCVAPALASSQTLEGALADTERRLLEATLERFRGNKSAAASALGIDRRTLYTKLRQYRRESDGGRGAT
jgi:DNA-binding NtrC family response regulator